MYPFPPTITPIFYFPLKLSSQKKISKVEKILGGGHLPSLPPPQVPLMVTSTLQTDELISGYEL